MGDFKELREYKKDGADAEEYGVRPVCVIGNYLGIPDYLAGVITSREPALWAVRSGAWSQVTTATPEV